MKKKDIDPYSLIIGIVIGMDIILLTLSDYQEYQKQKQ